ncbi:MAG: D-2-hydroxyacid dehydrogenase [Pseudoclavibacter sp.]
MLKVLFWSPAPFAREATLEALAATPGVETEVVQSIDDCIAGVGGADVLVLGDAPPPDAKRVVDAITAAGGRLRAMHFVSAGREGFEAVGFPSGVAVSGPTGANAPTVAEHALALTLAVLRQTGRMAINASTRAWDRSLVRGLRSLEGQTALIVGLGHIGREVATRLRAFGAHTIGLQRTPRPDASVAELGRIDELEAFLPRADLVVVTAALAPETAGLLNAERLALLPDHAVVVNVARGGLIDTDALAAALHAGELAGAGVDVTDPEPLPDGHALWSAPGVVISPHVAGGGSPASMHRIGQSVATCVRALQDRKEADANVG